MQALDRIDLSHKRLRVWATEFFIWKSICPAIMTKLVKAAKMVTIM